MENLLTWQGSGGFYDPAVAARVVQLRCALRNGVDPAVAYRAFRGRDAGAEALMKERGRPLGRCGGDR